MPKTKNYSLEVGAEVVPYKLSKVSSSSGSLLVLDVKSSTFNEYSFTHNSGIERKRIISRKDTRGKTYLTTNTSDVKATDVFDNGLPLFYKVDKLHSADKIIINNIEHTVVDDNFIYTNEKHPVVQYLDADNNAIEILDQESYPVFINSSYKFLADTVAKDSKTFSIGNKGLHLELKYSGKVTAIVKDEPVTQLQRQAGLHSDVFYIDQFVIFDSTPESQMEYNYSEVVLNKKSVVGEAKIVDTNAKVHLRNKNIFADSIYITVGSNTYKIIDHIDVKYINRTKASVDLTPLIGTLFNLGDKVSVDYKYTQFIGNNINLGSTGFGTINNKYKVFLAPSKVTVGSNQFFAKRGLSFVMIDQSGFIANSQSDFIMAPVVTPVLSGGEASNEDIYQTAYGEGGYGEGPYGGSTAITETDIDTIMDNIMATTGLKWISDIDFAMVAKEISIVENLHTPIVKPNCFEHFTVDKFSGAVVKFGTSDITTAYGIKQIGIDHCINIPVEVIKVGTTSVIAGDITNIIELSNAVIPVETDPALLAIFNEYADVSLNADLDYNNIIPFINNTPVTATSAVIDLDDKKIYFSLANVDVGDYVGIGYSTFKPMVNVKI